MYIEYIRNQWEARGSMGSLRDKPGISNLRMNENSKVPELKPTWLVRISDMKVVPGSSVNEHYWALSYSWNQSGELIHKGGEEYERIDKGRHRVIEYQRSVARIVMNKLGFSMVSDIDFDLEPASTVSVTFEGLVQQICKDFDIDYIWFDQMCINQGDHDAKMQEIKQMHKIYENACCTLALVPELHYTLENGIISAYANVDVLPSTHWCKRMWTLEEAYLSKDILFIGRNIHIWGDIDLIWNFTYATNTTKTKHSKREWMACTALWYAKKRTSSKAHDRIFALANIFPELMNGITFSYKQPLQHLMIQFYRDLAQKDISILLFGAPSISDLEDKTMAVRRNEASLLPSWTGVNGVHMTQFALKDDKPPVTSDHTISKDSMHIMTSFITVRIADAKAVERYDDFDNLDKYSTWYHRESKIECKAPRSEDMQWHRFAQDGMPMTRVSRDWNGRVVDDGSTSLVFVTTRSDLSHPFYAYMIRDTGLKPTHVLPLVVKDKTATNTLSKPAYWGGLLSLTEECSDCIVLFEPAFQMGPDFKLNPVIKKEEDCYRSIGVCIFDDKLDIVSIALPKQTFDIK